MVYDVQSETEEEQAREIFQALDHQLKEDLPQLLDLRIPYLDPSFECMVRPTLPLAVSLEKRD